MKYRMFFKHVDDDSNWCDHYKELDLPDRMAAEYYVKTHRDELAMTTGRYTGNVYGYAIELVDKDRETAILYPHKYLNLIWIELDN